MKVREASRLIEEVRKIIEKRLNEIIDKWNEHFGLNG